jgi:hypothetical protein
MNNPTNHIRVIIHFLFIGLVLLAPAPVGAGAPDLPAHDWNPANLARIQSLNLKDPVAFAVFGDSRNNAPVFERLLQQVNRDKDIKFALHLGDLVDYSDLGQYRLFFQQVREHLTIPLLAAVGNHELHKDTTGLYSRLFGPKYYSFRVHNHYFLVLEATKAGGLDEAQLRWLEAELQKARACQTRLVFMHTPLCDPRGGDHRHCLAGESAARVLGLLKKYQVSHVFAGHIHAYFAGKMEGIPYTITGGAGATLYREVPSAGFYNFLTVTLSGNRVSIEVHRVDESAKSSLGRELEIFGALAPGKIQLEGAYASN